MVNGADQLDFLKEWVLFISNLKKVCQQKIRQRGGVYGEWLGPLLNDVIRDIATDRAQQEVSQAIKSARAEERGAALVGYLTRELRFFNDLVKGFELNHVGEPRGNADSIDEALVAGQTIKESIEDFLKKLPGWLKKLLKVLNELMSIITGR